MPVAISIAQWARDPARSSSASRLSTSIEALIASITSWGPDEKRPPHNLLLVMTPVSEGPQKGMSRDQIAGLVMALLAAFGGVYAMLPHQDNGRPAAFEREFLVRFIEEPARPQAPGAAFLGPDGAPLRLAGFKGRVVLLNLWASWCEPCIRELPALDRLEGRRGGDGFTVVAVNLDRDPEDGRAFLRARGIRHLKFFHDDRLALFQALNVPGLPLSVLIDKEGREIGRLAGPAAWDGPAAHKLIEEAIAEESKSAATGD